MPKFAPRDRSPTRPVETELDADKTVAATGDGGNEQRERRQEHAPHDVVVDPESREVINRENDVRAQSASASIRTRRCFAIAPTGRRAANLDNTLRRRAPRQHQGLNRMPSLPLPQGKPLDVPRTMHQALELHHQGRIAEAEPLYAAVLAARPDHFDALQMLGVIKLARGELADGAAARSRPRCSCGRSRRRCCSNHGLVLNAMNRHEEALASFDEAIKHKGRFAEAHNNRGSVLMALGRCEEALDNFKRAIAIKPDYAEAFYNQGNAFRELDRHDEAIKSFDRAIALRPNYAKAHCNRGSVLDVLGRSADALAGYDRALAIAARYAEAMLNRCGALRALKRIDDTLQCLDRLLTVHPDYAEAHYMRGMLMADFNRPAEALASFEKAVALKPEYSKARWATCMAALPILYAEESRDRGATRRL